MSRTAGMVYMDGKLELCYPAPTKPMRATVRARRREMLDRAKGIVEDLRDYWPLTVRQVYHAYIAQFALPSVPRIYRQVKDLLMWARVNGEVPWEVLEDRTRTVLRTSAWRSQKGFVDAHRDHVLTDYRRDLQAGQTQRLEVWIEKDALAHIAQRAARTYTVPVGIARGFSSGSFKHDCWERIERAAADEQRTVILYFGDLDPSGAYMPEDIARAFREDFGAGDLVSVYQCALLPAQVAEHGLPASVDAFKPSDSRAAWFLRTFGEGQPCVELDALPAPTLEALVEESIEAWMDLGLVEQIRADEETEAEEVGALRADVLAVFP